MTNPNIDRSSVARTSPLVEPIHGKQPFETESDYSRFVAYLAAGPERTYKAVAESLGLHPVTLSKLGAECRWVARATQWDRELDEMLTKSLFARQVHARVEQADAGRMMRRLGVAALEHAAPDEIETKDATALIVNGSKVESAALGVAEKHELEVTVRDATTMTEAERRAEYAELRARLDAKIAELGGNQDETEDVQSA